jgi:haloacetate dehalogenase
MFEGFESGTYPVGETTIFARHAGSGPPVLLLHGFPQTHVMWAGVAPVLAEAFTLVCADLRGYGQSGTPRSDDRHAAYSKRAMAQDMVELMQHLGHARFAVGGHDRGARVAYRLALDHPERVSALAVLDIVPTEDVWERADAKLALAFWPWSLLAQPYPLPEQLIAGAPHAVVDDASTQWGSDGRVFDGEVRDAYVAPLRDAAHVHAICEEYRAGASIDREHDQADLAAGNKIRCPTLALWSAAGSLNTWYAQSDGPIGLWRRWCTDLEGQPVAGGHFFPEEDPAGTARLLGKFFARCAGGGSAT